MCSCVRSHLLEAVRCWRQYGGGKKETEILILRERSAVWAKRAERSARRKSDLNEQRASARTRVERTHARALELARTQRASAGTCKIFLADIRFFFFFLVFQKGGGDPSLCSSMFI